MELDVSDVPVEAGAAGPSCAVDSKTAEYQERMKQLRELQKKERDEKKKIADRIKADRRETDQRESKASVSIATDFRVVKISCTLFPAWERPEVWIQFESF